MVLYCIHLSTNIPKLYSSASTLVVNAANANAGRANRLVTGPVVVDIVRDASNVAATADSSPVLVRSARSVSINHMTSPGDERTSTDGPTSKRRLLVVDPGG